MQHDNAGRFMTSSFKRDAFVGQDVEHHESAMTFRMTVLVISPSRPDGEARAKKGAPKSAVAEAPRVARRWCSASWDQCPSDKRCRDPGTALQGPRITQMPCLSHFQVTSNSLAGSSVQLLGHELLFEMSSHVGSYPDLGLNKFSLSDTRLAR